MPGSNTKYFQQRKTKMHARSRFKQPATVTGSGRTWHGRNAIEPTQETELKSTNLDNK